MQGHIRTTFQVGIKVFPIGKFQKSQCTDLNSASSLAITELDFGIEMYEVHIYIHLNVHEMRDHRNDERYWAKQLRKESVRKYPGLNSCVSFRSCVHNRDALSFIILQ